MTPPILRLDAIVLAAGSGTRFGGGKLTANWRGGLLIEGALAAAWASPAREVFVVTGADTGVETAVGRFAGEGRVHAVFAPDHAVGLSASLCSGLTALPLDCDGVFVFLGDMPWVPHEIALILAARLSRGAAAAAPMFGNRRGHPVLFSRSLFAALAQSEGDQGARDVLRGLGRSLATVPTLDRGVLADVDTPSDLSDSLPSLHVVFPKPAEL